MEQNMGLSSLVNLRQGKRDRKRGVVTAGCARMARGQNKKRVNMLFVGLVNLRKGKGDRQNAAW